MVRQHEQHGAKRDGLLQWSAFWIIIIAGSDALENKNNKNSKQIHIQTFYLRTHYASDTTAQQSIHPSIHQSINQLTH